mmetsp:Transcript_19514/g.34462  ORF Transcript_19514/g.34462 Transcript_19514/m.34462 type:complete len:331 (+) Transcript_19514:130-1122(+)
MLDRLPYLLVEMLRELLRKRSSRAVTGKACSDCQKNLAVVGWSLAASGLWMKALALLRRLASAQPIWLGLVFARATLATTQALNLRSARRLLAGAAVSTVLLEGRRAYDGMLLKQKHLAQSRRQDPQWCRRILMLMNGKAQRADCSEEVKFPQAQTVRTEAKSRRGRRPVHDEASRILSWLYIGGEKVAADRVRLQQLGIGYVLNCCENLPFASTETQNKRVFLRDTRVEQLVPQLSTAFQFLDEVRRCNGRCLVHCRQGVSRSVSVVLAYLVMRDGLQLRDAWSLMQTQRPAARPNRGFCEQLIDLDTKMHGEASASLSDFLPDEVPRR